MLRYSSVTLFPTFPFLYREDGVGYFYHKFPSNLCKVIGTDDKREHYSEGR